MAAAPAGAHVRSRDTPMVYLEIVIVLLLMLVNGVLAMSEIAMVSSRRSRLDDMAAHGSRGARTALRLIDDPNRFLSTVQIGITLVGILAGAFGGATLAERLGAWLDTFPAIAPNGGTIAIGLVVAAITYLSLIIGELVPKRIGLTHPERIAALIAGPMNALSRVTGPIVWLLKASTEAVLGLLRLSAAREAAVTEDEVKALIAEGTRAGVFVPAEREMIQGVLRLADRPVRVIMTLRPDIAWIDLKADREAVLRAVEEQRFSRLLVCDGTVDRAVGVVSSRDLLPVALRGEPFAVAEIMTPALVVLDRTPVLKLLDLFKRERLHMAVVVDEYGSTEGLVTPTDVLESIAGELPERGQDTEPLIVRRADGSWLVDGLLPIDEFEDRTGLRGIREESDYHTVAGFVLQRFGHLPTAGESFVHNDTRFEVVDMDGRRIDKVLVAPAGNSDDALDQSI